jgi:hypothetical protein
MIVGAAVLPVGLFWFAWFVLNRSLSHAFDANVA